MAMTGGTAKLVSQGTPSSWPGPISLYVYYKQVSQSITNNTTTLSLGMYVTTPSGWYFGPWTDYYGSYVGTATSGANCKTFNGSCPSNTQGTRWLVENQEITVTHESNGTKKATIYWHWGVNSGWSGVMNNASGSFSIDLPTIPRAATITATDANIESATTITVVRPDSSFTTTVHYKAAGQTIYTPIWSKQTHTSYGWTVPSSLYSLIPDDKEIEITLLCQTYSNGTLLGSNTCTFTAFASESKCKPSISVVSEDVNPETLALTGNKKHIITGLGNLRLVTTATPKNGASIKSVTAYCKSVSTTGTASDITFIGAQSGSVYVIVKDSRGFSTRYDDTSLTFRNYVVPTITPTITRDTPTGDTVTVDVKGLWFNGSFGAVNNTLRVRVRYKADGTGNYGEFTDLTVTKNGHEYTATVNLSGLAYTNAYRFQIRLDDEVYTDTKGYRDAKYATDIYLSKGIPVFDWGENDFQFNVPVLLHQQSLFSTPTTSFSGDANEVTYSAMLRTSSGAINCPSNNGFLIAFAPVPGQVVLQIGGAFNGKSMMYRTLWYGTWYDWIAM